MNSKWNKEQDWLIFIIGAPEATATDSLGTVFKKIDMSHDPSYTVYDLYGFADVTASDYQIDF